MRWTALALLSFASLSLSTKKALGADAPIPGSSHVVEGFSQVRQEVMGLISGATKRIWLSSEYLTDGDVVSGLYLAQYRKINVSVLLGRKKANAYMSRLGFLKAQSIPVFLKPDGFVAPPTAMLVDDRLVLIDGDLDFRANYKKFTVSVAPELDMRNFEAAFSKAANVAIPATAAPMPLVGKDSGGRSRVYNGSSAALDQDDVSPGRAAARGKRYRPPMGAAKYSDEEMQGSFGYSYKDRKAPKGVPKQLPRQTLYQKLEQERQKLPPETPEIQSEGGVSGEATDTSGEEP